MRRLIIIAVVVVVVILAFVVIAAILESNTSSSTWITTKDYPLQVNGVFGVSGQQCVNSTGYVYCIGGEDLNEVPRDNVYSSSALSSSSGNITSWTSDSHQYPQNIGYQSCVAYSSYVYCVGGSYDDAGDDVASSYYASLSGNGTVGSWVSTTAYPIPIDTEYCAAYAAHIYCVGGENETGGDADNTEATNSVWYAPISSSGIGNWTHSTPYPTNLYFPSCFASNGYIYCIGGADGNDNSQNTDYYAALSPTGVGTWTSTTPYPLQASDQACAFSSGDIYCVGGEESASTPSYTNAVYYATASSGGIGTWKQAGNYPDSAATTCVITSGNMYCMGGSDGSAAGVTAATYYVPLTSLSTTTTAG